MEIEKRLEELGFVLPDAETPIANYIVARRTGNLVYTAGQVGNAAKDGFGKLGSEVTRRGLSKSTTCCTGQLSLHQEHNWRPGQDHTVCKTVVHGKFRTRVHGPTRRR